MLIVFPCHFREGTNLEIQVDIETKPSHLCLTSEEDLAPHACAVAQNSVEEPQDCSSRQGILSRSLLGLASGGSLREGLGDVTLAQPESIRSDLETSDTQSDDIAELTSEDCDLPHSPPQPTCRALNSSDGLQCPDNVILYVWKEPRVLTAIHIILLFLKYGQCGGYCLSCQQCSTSMVYTVNNSTNCVPLVNQLVQKMPWLLKQQKKRFIVVTVVTFMWQDGENVRKGNQAHVYLKNCKGNDHTGCILLEYVHFYLYKNQAEKCEM